MLSEVQIRLDDPPPHGDVADHDEDEGQGEADAEEEGARVDKSGLRVNHVALPEIVIIAECSVPSADTGHHQHDGIDPNTKDGHPDVLEHTVCHLRIAQTKTPADRHRGNGHEGCVSVDVTEAAVQHTSVIAGRTVSSVDELKRKRKIRYPPSSKCRYKVLDTM